jgi:hypothetical protein
MINDIADTRVIGNVPPGYEGTPGYGCQVISYSDKTLSIPFEYCAMSINKLDDKLIQIYDDRAREAYRRWVS